MATVAVMEKARSCEVTGLRVDRSAELLIKLNAVSAVVFLLLGALAAIGMALTRWEAVRLLPAEWYYRLTSFHGINMLVFWIVFFEAAGLVFGSTVVLNSRMVAPKVGILAWLMMVAGTVCTDAVVLFGKYEQATVMFTAYVPMKSHPAFYLGYILFAVGALIYCILFYCNVFNARREKTYEGAVPLFTYGLAAAATIAIFALLHGAITMVPALLWSLGVLKDIDPAMYRVTFWGFGHTAQQINLCAMVSIWYLLGTLTVGGLPVNEKLCRSAFLLYVLFINLGCAHHLLVDPAVGESWKIFNTSYAMYLAVLASMIHAFSIPASVEIAQRRNGFTTGLFEWVKKGPWGNPGFSALALSLLIFGFLGGVSGVIIGTEQINLRVHNTLRVPGHFHTTVVGGTSLAFMGLTYYVIPLIFRREWFSRGAAKIQPWLFAFGITVMSVSMTALGMMGVSRRHYDIAMTGSTIPSTFTPPPTAKLLQAGLGIGGCIAGLAVIIFALNAVATLLVGRRVTGAPAWPPAAIRLPSQATPVAHNGRFHAPGTFVLALVFLAFFVVMYASNWAMLTKAWPIR